MPPCPCSRERAFKTSRDVIYYRGECERRHLESLTGHPSLQHAYGLDVPPLLLRLRRGATRHLASVSATIQPVLLSS